MHLDREQIFKDEKVAVGDVLRELRDIFRKICKLRKLTNQVEMTAAEAGIICRICHAKFNGRGNGGAMGRDRVLRDVLDFVQGRAGLPYSTLYVYAHLNEDPVRREQVHEYFWDIFVRVSELRGETPFDSQDLNLNKICQAPAT